MAQGGTVHVLSSQHPSGQQLAQLGGAAAVLKFAVPELDDIDSEADVYDDLPAAAGSDDDSWGPPTEGTAAAADPFSSLW